MIANSYPLPHEDGELIAAAMAYLTISMMQEARPDAHLIVKGAPVVNTHYWPAGWDWAPEATPRGNLLKARNMINAQLAEPGGEYVAAHGYPHQGDVADWHDGTDGAATSLSERALDLLREVGALRTALLVRQEHGNHQEWAARIRVAFGDVFLHLLDLAEAAGFDLEAVAALRWREITMPAPKEEVSDETPQAASP